MEDIGERRQITIPIKRIQAIRIRENIVRQWLGYATVYVESGGGSFEHKEGAKVMVLRMIKLDQLPAVLKPMIPDYHFSFTLTPLPGKSLRRYLFRSSCLTIPPVIVALILLKWWGILSLVLLVISSVWAFFCFKDAGFRIDQKQLTLRYRGIVRNTFFIKKEKIQALKVKESYFQRKQELATIELFAKSGLAALQGKLPDAALGDVEGIYHWYTVRTQAQPDLKSRNATLQTRNEIEGAGK